MIRMRTELLGVEGVQRALDDLARRLSDATPAWRDILANWKSEQKRVFSSQGGSIGANWPPLSPRYAEWKQRHYGGRPMLVRSGSLRAAAEGESSGFFAKISALGLELGITHRVAQIQNARRPIMRFSEIEQRRWYRLMQLYVERSASAAGR
jgi:hypothetical protein